MQRNLLVVLLLVGVGQASGQSTKANSKSPTLFLIKDRPIYADEFLYLYKKNHLKKEDFAEQKITDYLGLLINFKLKVSEAKERGLDTMSAFKKEFKSYRNELKKPYVGDKDELDRLTKEAYQRLTEEVKTSHVLITTGVDAAPKDTILAFNKISKIRERIMGGENFEKVAKDESEDASAKTNGGNLGFFTALQMVYPFEQAAYTTSVGQVSQPVRTRSGYHLIKVTGRRPSRGEVEVSHIILRTGQKDNSKVKNKALEIYDQLRGGRSWEELCKEYSDDPATKNSGGRLRPFGVGALPSIPEFEAVAFSLTTKGDISDPFQSVYGWHIVRLEKKMPLPSFQEVEASLRKKVGGDERLQIADARRLEVKKRQYGFTENADVKNGFVVSADSSLQNARWRFRGEAEFKARTIFTLQDQKTLAADFISFILTEQRRTSAAPASYLIQLYNQFVLEEIGDIEDVKLRQSNPEYRNLLTEYEEGILLFTIMEKEVWTKASEDTLGLRKYYDANKDKYRAGDRVHAKVFATTDKNFMDEVKQRVMSGDSLKKEDLKKFKSILPARHYERGENKAVDKVSWSIGLHSVEVNETYYLVEIDNLVPPGIKSFEETRAHLISDYQDVLEKDWIAGLNRKFPVKINSKGRKFVINELTKSEK